MFQSPQAITISVFYFIMFLIVAFLAFKSLSFIDALKVLTPFLITTLLLVYDTDCLVTGGCVVYSWIRTILYLISIVIIINIVSLTIFTATSIASAADKEIKSTPVVPTIPPVVQTTTPAATTTKVEETKKDTTVAVDSTKSTDPSGTSTKTIEKFASWEQ